MAREEGAAAPAPQKTVLVGVTGCIAAYKACEVVRRLQKAGVRAKVVMTEHATGVREVPRPSARSPASPWPWACSTTRPTPSTTCRSRRSADCLRHRPLHGQRGGQAGDAAWPTTCSPRRRSPPRASLVVAPAMNVHMYRTPRRATTCGKLHIRGATHRRGGRRLSGLRRRGTRAAWPSLADIVAAAPRGAGRAPRPGRPPRHGHGRAHRGAHRPGALPHEPLVGQDRLRPRAGRGRPRGRRRRSCPARWRSPSPRACAPCACETAREMLAAAQEAFRDGRRGRVLGAAVADMRPRERCGAQAEEGPQATMRCSAPSSSWRIPTSWPRSAPPSVPARWWWASPPRPTTWWPTPSAKLASEACRSSSVANEVGEGRAFGTDDNEVWFVTAEETYGLPLMPKDRLADRILDVAASFLP